MRHDVDAAILRVQFGDAPCLKFAVDGYTYTIVATAYVNVLCLD